MSKELYLEDSYRQDYTSNVKLLNKDKVILEETIFHPNGGGQPNDEGWLYQNGKAYKVINVRKEGEEIIHYLEDADDLEEDEVRMKINWSRRYNFMKYHTLLHLVAGHLYHEYGALAIGNQIFENRARLDIDFRGGELDVDFHRVEEELNRLINEGRKMNIRNVERDSESISEKIRTVINLIPASVKNIRLVAIENMDEQPCSGTHVNNINEIGPFKISGNKSKGKGKRRLEFQLIEKNIKNG
ncbi:alanyl-tRNA editing protein [Halalkalibacterium halodurans]|uniref:BH2934 protein n=1 Tax=Halalkalibacterium halodurans (strain ATCC BAA-125 / DSM 18197 / FERM 7344 / JCM 9153 / C-125) TaxID=272558 RepID=Q9K8R9_HALH5|nr:alanyl-tRNA editing protein [Halalkalibacterium halodurans]MDY7223485.1 alanyl-tRNA editing protein [Halalkalibacterium halodurans]MDY7242706.1 alanyl-tRNA editing protein [Halalkalibacterium halodurans]MED4081586.1 alanyl-tRNA editing protein [Halalkalibacterium halodurans]MED4085002.1 alanyl-tRNA editing protein [Halalkalibacterium halodurans]MED4104111.1 alanyl-tRNA editing protein [Halalkalibacterium halodurans]